MRLQNNNLSILTQKIKALAVELGFDQVGITSLDSIDEGRKQIEDWVREERHGTMKYLEEFEARRQRLLEQIPSAKSVICLGVNYFQETKDKRPKTKDPNEEGLLSLVFGLRSALRGRVARYAWGKDYHHVIRQKHQTFIARLKEIVTEDIQAISCVDTHAVPERFAALQSGLGFIGKHTGLLNSKFGPWLFLSEIITDMELETDLPIPGTCGKCTHCQDVCPTGALDQDYRIDARKCIAYLTIEHKGTIARELRPKIKDWIFGCDECLDICPFTSKEKETTWPEFKAPEGTGPELSIEELFDLSSNAKYEKKFEGTALRRTGLKQMLRNACIVLGNSKSREAIPLLEKGVSHPSPLVREHAAWALGQIAHEEARLMLHKALALESDMKVRAEIEIAISDWRPRDE